ncbi:hypothetical protein [Archangium lansingense]|uniref:Uncharacterized protein n=1 Tax=Archangium lansingense TaxID=2995310 RepID=A0ABT4AHZ4_9BACT|nr:hypothetical protein [Archangium lansinium]MCY1081275.1 hypothetical protein [Archangium lansinium]
MSRDGRLHCIEAVREVLRHREVEGATAIGKGSSHLDIVQVEDDLVFAGALLPMMVGRRLEMIPLGLLNVSVDA